ncbi:MAG TPA: KamA family radical SAM protein [Thermoanaerobaculaceae bacterium]|nr:KamA family radical SAM protein [Thermoanaerobaculaceae bacterium]HRS14746.1 KamA family radical SAM protein [Thermoanaerobaculaceae bacterium]
MNETTASAEPLIAGARRLDICRILGETYDTARWNDWRWQMRHRLGRLEQLEQLLELTPGERRGLALCQSKLAVAITPYLAERLDPFNPACPLRMQVVPREEEALVAPSDMVDPCGEECDSVAPGLVHRYPDRVLLLATDTCAAYCRYCTRSRLVAHGRLRGLGQRIDAIVDYLRAHTEVRDVLVSGGDPLLFSNEKLDELLGRIRTVPHVEMLRIGTRVVSFLPQRITPELVAVLRRHRVWLSLHFSHAAELTPEVARACDLLADGGIPLGSQTVLLRGINDSVQALRELFCGLLRLRVRPYYLYQCDPVVGTSHLRTTVAKGLELVAGLRGHTSGYAVPTYVIDAPGGGGKVPLHPETVIGYEDGAVVLRNWQGRVFTYRDPAVAG